MPTGGKLVLWVLGAAAVGCGGRDPGPAPAPPDRPGLSQTYGSGSLVPTPTEERVRYRAALAGELDRMLEQLDGVREARVILADPGDDPLTVPLDPETPPRPASAAVVLALSGHGPTASEVQRLVASAAPAIRPDQVTVAMTTAAAPPAAPALSRLGPFTVASESRVGLLVTFAVGLGAVTVLAGLVLLLGWKLAALRRRPS